MTPMSEAAAAPAWDLFVSYADADRAWAEGYLLDGLRSAGVRCRTQADFGLGARWGDEFERAAAQSPRVLLVLSRAYLADDRQRLLDGLARYHELKTEAASVIPLLLEEMELPLGLEAKVSLRAVTDEERAQAVERLARACQAKAPIDADRLACPYPGMAAFDRRNAALFHGRRREVEDLLQELRHRRCLFLIGRSGSGKSSLALAGLLPRLEEGRTVHVMRPGATPAATLAALTAGGGGRRLLVVDQFEEVYTRSEAGEATRFQEALVSWLEAPEQVLLATVRSDFYPDLQGSPAVFPLFQANHRDVLPLGREGLREAIVAPAAQAGVFVEPALVERLLADAAGEPGVLPHLQETMQLLWERRLRRYLSLEAYHELGRQARTGLQQAMAVAADATVGTLKPEEQALARRTLLRLVQFGEGREDSRRQQPLAALENAGDAPGSFERVLARLILRRLVVPDRVRVGATDATVIDLAHEALITGWPKLQGWVREWREAEQTRRRLEGHAGEWVRLGRGAGGLFDVVELHEAEQWLARHGGEMGASVELRGLVEASREEVAARRREAEEVREERVRQAQALAAEQLRRVRILRWSLLGAAVLLVALAGAAVVAWRQRQATEEAWRQDSRNTARSHARAAEEALKRGAWQTALDSSDAALGLGFPDEVGLRLVKVKAFAALNHLAEARRELQALAVRTDLGEYEGSVRLWQGDFLLSLARNDDAEALRLVREAREKHIKHPAEEEYALALLADDWKGAVGHLNKALEKDPVHRRANAMLAGVYFWSGRLPQARERVAFAEFLFPDDPMLTILHALICATEGQEKEARALAAKAAGRLSGRQANAVKQFVDVAVKLHAIDLAFARGEDLAAIMFKAVLWYPEALGLAARFDAVLLPSAPPFMVRAVSSMRAEIQKIVNIGDLKSLPALMAAAKNGELQVRVLAVLGRGADVFPEGLLSTSRATQLFFDGRWDEAEQALTGALETPSLFRSVRLFALLEATACERNLAAGRPPQPAMRARAVEHLRELVWEVLRLDRMGAYWGTLTSVLALQLKEFELARFILGEWEKRAPNDLALLEIRLQVECGSGEYSRAVDVADQILKGKPRDPSLVKKVRDQQAFALEKLQRQLEAHPPSRPDPR
jgi:hypothetical protein